MRYPMRMGRPAVNASQSDATTRASLDGFTAGPPIMATAARRCRQGDRGGGEKRFRGDLFDPVPRPRTWKPMNTTAIVRRQAEAWVPSQNAEASPCGAIVKPPPSARQIEVYRTDPGRRLRPGGRPSRLLSIKAGPIAKPFPGYSGQPGSGSPRREEGARTIFLNTGRSRGQMVGRPRREGFNLVGRMRAFPGQSIQRLHQIPALGSPAARYAALQWIECAPGDDELV